ncbi:MAG: DNA-binding NtrC family response regulator [bacterium]|jgi:DNA-binding NtrC family response regulator
MVVKDPILIVDDEVEMRIAMSAALKRCGYPVELSHNAIDALNKFKKKNYSMVITDMTMPKRSGVELLKDVKALKPEIPVVLVTAYGTIETAVESMKYGAFDYVLKPFDFDTFIFLIERALAFKGQPKTQKRVVAGAVDKGRKSGSYSTDSRSSGKDIITEAPKMLELLEMVRNVAGSKATILVQSESGTGKELLARYIHNNSDRKDKPFIAINCAALPDTLLESELFGHKKGAFTGAINDHRGKFEQANGGTILLDEVSEMALPLQAKLLRVLQEHTVDRVGGTDSVSIDVRIVATTNRKLLEYVEEGNFREDLYFRLNVIPVTLPPLRERRGDVVILADYFAKKYAKQNKKGVPKLSKEALHILENYNWRGNIRELENVMERAVLLSSEIISPANLLMTDVYNMASLGKAKSSDSSKVEESITSVEEVETVASAEGTLNLKVGVSMWEAERQLIFETLRKTEGNRTKAAEILGISIRTLRNKLNEYKTKGDLPDFVS